MPPTLSRAAVRAFDHRCINEFGLPGAVLMENAGRGATEFLLSLGVTGPVVVCCARGNNGGDGFVMARHLDAAGVPVRVLLFARAAEVQGDARTFLDVVRRSGIPLVEDAAAALTADQLAAELAGADWIVDALFGTGLQGPVRPPFDGVIRAVNAAGRRVFAVDLPSGLDADTGQATDPTVRAAATATFVALKPGFLSPGADRVTGAVRVVGIGAPGLLLRGLAAPNDA